MSNLPDFKRQMAHLSLELQGKAVRRATAAAAGALRAEGVRAAAAPKATPPARLRTGTLARAVYMTRNRRTSTKGAERYLVGIRQGRKAARIGRDAFYARFLEGGWIPRGPGQRIAGGRRRKALERSRLASKRVQYPFFQSAMKAGSGRAVDVFVRRLEREVKRLGAIR
jgi:hypothetical protein